MDFWVKCYRSQFARVIGLGTASLLVLANCTTDNVAGQAHIGSVAASSRIKATGETAAKSSAVRKRAAVRTHADQKNIKYSAVGTASWYGEDFHGRQTANGEKFDMNSLSAAHPSLPLPSTVRVTNLNNHRSVVVRVNDRGPYVGGRVIDVSARTAKELGFHGDGLGRVKVEYVGRAHKDPATAAE